MSKHEQDVPSAPDVPVAGHELWQRRLQDRYAAKAAQGHAPLSTSDADKYRWIRANRGNYAIVNALNDSDRDSDFDAQIEAAMRMSVAGRHYYSR